MPHTLRLTSLACALLLAGVIGTSHAQGSPMTTQFGLGVLLGLGDHEYTGGEFRAFVPIPAVEGLRVIPELGFSVNNINDHVFLASLSVSAAYTPFRFAGRNGGAYVKAGPRYDYGFNTDVDNASSGDVGANLGLGVQASVGPIDIYAEFEHLFVDSPVSINQLIIGLTIAAN